MKLDRPTVRRVHVQVIEYEGNKAIKGSVRTISVWETTSDEVLAIIQAALDAASNGTGLPRGRANAGARVR